MNSESFETVVIGGGIFGCYSALTSASHGRTLVIESNNQLMGEASFVNQARVHGRYHYPRSLETAITSQRLQERFMLDHAQAINDEFHHYYGIANQGSMIDGDSFERFCNWLGAPVQAADRNFFLEHRVSESYLVKEPAFDAFEVRKIYEKKLHDVEVDIRLNTFFLSARINEGRWILNLRLSDGKKVEITAKRIINATYRNTNAVLMSLGLPLMKLRYEISEVVLAYIPNLKGIGLTVMDGPFLSVMPFGTTGLHSITSVLYTHHVSSDHYGGKFSCQGPKNICSPFNLKSCNSCVSKPKSARNQMIKHVNNMIRNPGDIFVHDSLITIKTTSIPDAEIKNANDSRRTDVRFLRRKPDFVNVLSGKVNSIYELDWIAIEKP